MSCADDVCTDDAHKFRGEEWSCVCGAVSVDLSEDRAPATPAAVKAWHDVLAIELAGIVAALTRTGFMGESERLMLAGRLARVRTALEEGL